MNKITFSTLLLGIITFCIISCAPEEKKHSLTAGEVPLGVSCDSLEREFATKWTNLAEYDQGQAHYYQTSTVFLDRFQDKLANCFATIPKENITKILGEPTLVMTIQRLRLIQSCILTIVTKGLRKTPEWNLPSVPFLTGKAMSLFNSAFCATTASRLKRNDCKK